MDSSQLSDLNRNDPNISSNSSLDQKPAFTPPQIPKPEASITCRHILSTNNLNNFSCEEIRYLKYNKNYASMILKTSQNITNIPNPNHPQLFTNKSLQPTFPDENIICKHVLSTSTLQYLSCEELRNFSYNKNTGIKNTGLKNDQLSFGSRASTSNVPKFTFTWK
ncbi:hypothetical protein SteCoe_4852 [Stentor coeruleus]|uniref:Uncharacterized protein n=1 Tax=Stentor coeruleus TaxID=5963 RepID=A0A1R2CTV0_9CILI|nr:hypothetical protein SteCoe_4852 [Stentor coeruleus]